MKEDLRNHHDFIELHDSEIAVAWFARGAAIILFSNAYIHKKTAEFAGRDHITGWWQRAELVIEGSPEIDLPTHWPVRIYDGTLTIGNVEYPNTIPLSLDSTEEVRLELETMDDESRWRELLFTGKGVRLTLLGEPVYCEESSLLLEENYQRIFFSDDNQIQIFQHPSDGAFWKLTYPMEGKPGVGTPEFALISEKEAQSFSKQ